MAHLKVWLRSPQSRQRLGVIRLAVLGVMLAITGIILLTSARHRAATASTGKTISALAPQKGCGYRKSDDIAGVRLHHIPTAAGAFRLAQSAGGERSGADVIIPDAARWSTWVLAPGDRRTLATSQPFPSKGRWIALFGTITDGGHGTVTYAAPAYVPPYGLDEIDYGGSLTGPNIQLMVSVRGGKSRKAAHPALSSRRQPTTAAPLSLLRRVPADIRGNYARTVRWIRQQRSAVKPARITDGGYVLPAWVDDASVLVYTPTESPSRAQANVPTRPGRSIVSDAR